MNNLTLIAGVGDGESTACLMSARALLDGRGLTDDHPSDVIRTLGIGINDAPWWVDDAERTRVLLPIALDDRMCASRVDSSVDAEIRRAYLCADRAVRVWAPRALDAAGLSDHAATLRALDPLVDDRTTRAAADAAAVARAAAYAAAYAAYAAKRWAAWAVARAAADAARWAADAARWARARLAAWAAAYAANSAEADADAAAAAARWAAGPTTRDEAIDLLLELCEVRA